MASWPQIPLNALWHSEDNCQLLLALRNGQSGTMASFHSLKYDGINIVAVCVDMSVNMLHLHLLQIKYGQLDYS